MDSSLKRLYLDHCLGKDVSVELDEARKRRLRHVMRFRGGEIIRVFNGDGGEWSARVEAQCGGVRVLERVREQPTGKVGPAVVFCPIKAMEYLLIKGTELGASAFYPVLSERTVVRRLNRSRMQAWIIGAAEQCERLDLPIIHEIQPLETFCRAWQQGQRGQPEQDGQREQPGQDGQRDTASPILYGTMDGDHVIDLCYPAMAEPPAACLIGPEGGFSPREMTDMRQFSFLKACQLSANVLRSETAVAAALAIMAALGNQEKKHGNR